MTRIYNLHNSDSGKTASVAFTTVAKGSFPHSAILIYSDGNRVTLPECKVQEIGREVIVTTPEQVITFKYF